MHSKRHLSKLLVLSCFVLISSCKRDHPTDNAKNQQSAVIEADPVIQGISQMIESSPGNHELYQKRGDLLYQRERYTEAAKDLYKAIEIKEDIPEYYHLLADILLDGSQSREAIKAMEQVIKKYPDRIPSFLKLAEFQLILRIDPQNADAYFLLGMNFREMGDIPKALNSLQRSVEIDADMIDAWILLGNIYENKKDPIAERYYQNAIDADPARIESLHTLAFYLQNQDRIDEALKLYNTILELDPKYSDAHLNAGILQLSIDSLDAALNHFNLLINMNPSGEKGYYYRGLTMELLGKTEQAINDYESSINLKSEDNPAVDALYDMKVNAK